MENCLLFSVDAANGMHKMDTGNSGWYHTMPWVQIYGNDKHLTILWSECETNCTFIYATPAWTFLPVAICLTGSFGIAQHNNWTNGNLACTVTKILPDRACIDICGRIVRKMDSVPDVNFLSTSTITVQLVGSVSSSIKLYVVVLPWWVKMESTLVTDLKKYCVSTPL